MALLKKIMHNEPEIANYNLWIAGPDNLKSLASVIVEKYTHIDHTPLL